MPKLPVISPKRFIRAIEKIGFLFARSRGSHHIYAHPDGRITIVPVHSRDIPKGTIHGMLKDIDVPVEQFLQLLKK